MTQSAMWENKLLLEWRGEIINAHKPQSISFYHLQHLKPQKLTRRAAQSLNFLLFRAMSSVETLPLLCLQEVRGVQLNEGLGQLQKFTFLELEIGGGWWTPPDVNAG